MATQAQAQARQTVKKQAGPKEYLYSWEGKDKAGKTIRGETRAPGANVVKSMLRRQGILPTKVAQQKMSKSRKVKERDIAVFTRQLATMMGAGVPILQAFDISIKGSTNPGLSKLLNDIRNDIAAGSSLAQAFGRHPLYFDHLYCNLINAGEQAGILDNLLTRLAVYKEKILALKSKIKSALFYPIAVIVVAALVVTIMMLFVIPEFKSMFENFGASLPAPTQFVVDMSDFFVSYWYLILGIPIAAVIATMYFYKRSPKMQHFVDRTVLKLPIIGDIIMKATVARWTRTLSTMFAAGVPLVEALDSVGGAAGNQIYLIATKGIQNEVSTGTSLTVSMQNANVFPSMVVQMVSIGEESGQLDSMLAKVSEFYEEEVDTAVGNLSTLLEPIIMVFLGVVIGGLVISMYLPIFKMGSVV